MSALNAKHLGECRWNYRLSISVSRVRVPPSHRDVAQSGRAGSFHHTLVAGARARSSVVEQQPFKRCVVGSIPTGHARNTCRRNACGTTRRRGPSGLEVQILRAGSSPAQRSLWWRKLSRSTLSSWLEKKGIPRRMPKELHGTNPG